MEASAPTVTDTVVVPEVPKDCPRATGPTSSAAAAIVRKSFFMFVFSSCGADRKGQRSRKSPGAELRIIVQEKVHGNRIGIGGAASAPAPRAGTGRDVEHLRLGRPADGL